MNGNAIDAGVGSGRQSPSSLKVWTATLYAATLPFDIFTVGMGRTLTFPVGIALIILWAFDKVGNRAVGRLPGALASLLYAYFGWIIATSFWSADRTATLLGSATMALQFLVVAALGEVLPFMWMRALKAYVFGSGILAVLMFSWPSQEMLSGRRSIAGADENITGMVLALGFGVALFLMRGGKARSVVWYGFAAMVTAAATVETGSRTGLVALSVALFVHVLQAARERRQRARLLIIATLFVVGFVAALRSGHLPDRISLFVESGVVRDPIRVQIIEMFLRASDEWMVSGIGFNADAAFLAKSAGVFFHAHNLYWQTWIQLGVIGLALFGALMSYFIALGAKSNARHIFVLLTSIVAIYSLTLGGQGSNVIWFVLALALVSEDPSKANAASFRGAAEGTLLLGGSDGKGHPVTTRPV